MCWDICLTVFQFEKRKTNLLLIRLTINSQTVSHVPEDGKIRPTREGEGKVLATQT